MPSSGRLLLAVVIALLSLSLSCPAATAMGNDDYYGGAGGRVGTIVIHGRGTTTGVAAAAATTGAGTPSSSKWQRRLEEAVAPEFGTMLDQAYINYNSLNKDRPACGASCAAQGASYTQPCYYYNHCRG